MKRRLRAYKKTVSIVNEKAIELYKGLGIEKKGFLLEGTDKESGQYTFMGVEPNEIIQSDKDSLVITRKDGSREVREGNPLIRLKEYFDEFEIVKDPGELDFIGGLVGSLGYDYIRYTEVLPDDNPDEIGIETIQLMLADKFIAINHTAETFTAVVLGEDSEEGRIKALKEAEEIIKTAREGVDKFKDDKPDMSLDGVVLKKSDTLEEYSEKVNKIKNYIKEGHIFQTVLSQRWTIKTGQSGFNLYEKLRELNPSPYMYYFNFGDFEIIGSSPEMIVKQSDNKVYTCPIAGTRKRGATKEQDIALEEELLADEKERAEHVMLVDLARNDMGRISEIGTVKVDQFMNIQRYSHVMHIGSTVEGELRDDCKAIDAVDAVLPAGTLSGAPKIRACEIINELEDNKRGIYGGAIGYIDFAGNLDTCIAIRIAYKVKDKIMVRSGAGVVADSVPESEFQECLNKARAVLNAVEQASAMGKEEE